jgi:hypothetical protein
MLFTVYNKYTNEWEFTGTQDECQAFFSGYGGGWAALDTRPADEEEKEYYENNKIKMWLPK